MGESKREDTHSSHTLQLISCVKFVVISHQTKNFTGLKRLKGNKFEKVVIRFEKKEHKLQAKTRTKNSLR